jgi:HAD superfamily hydrolase (TIGR01509 family)
VIKALIFDFDGLMLDTETPDYEVWRDLYREYGYELDTHTWGQIVGGNSGTAFEPLPHLEQLTGRDLSSHGLNAIADHRRLARIDAMALLPGVLETLEEARKRGLRLGVASSSPHAWVDGHLRQRGLLDQFQAIVCREDAPYPKPEPDLYLAALRALRIGPHEAIALEDSPNGVTAARRAGIFVVAVPNPLTARLSIQGEDLRLESLADLPLGALLDRL